MQLWQMSRFSLRSPEQNEKNPGGDEPAKPENICLCLYIYIYRTPNNQFFWMDVWWNNHFPRHPTETIHKKWGDSCSIRGNIRGDSTSGVWPGYFGDQMTSETRFDCNLLGFLKEMAAKVASKVSKRCYCFFLCADFFLFWRRFWSVKAFRHRSLGVFFLFFTSDMFYVYYVLYIVYMYRSNMSTFWIRRTPPQKLQVYHLPQGGKAFLVPQKKTKGLDAWLKSRRWWSESPVVLEVLLSELSTWKTYTPED